MVPFPAKVVAHGLFRLRELAEKTGMGQKDTRTLIDGLFESVSSHLKQGDKVQLTGFGTFEVR